MPLAWLTTAYGDPSAWAAYDSVPLWLTWADSGPSRTVASAVFVVPPPTAPRDPPPPRTGGRSRARPRPPPPPSPPGRGPRPAAAWGPCACAAPDDRARSGWAPARPVQARLCLLAPSLATAADAAWDQVPAGPQR